MKASQWPPILRLRQSGLRADPKVVATTLTSYIRALLFHFLTMAEMPNAVLRCFLETTCLHFLFDS